MNTKRLILALTLFAFCFSAGSLLAQPGFEDYQWQPQVAKSANMEAEYNSDPVGFRARYFPKLGIPILREDYFGIWNWFNHGAFPYYTVYDRDNSKRTYFFCRTTGQECGHNAVDWLVSFRNFGSNEVINPFPYGATVKVTGAFDSAPDEYATNSLGNSVELTCYLDGDPNNDDRVNRLMVRLSHLKQNSVVVNVGQFVNPGQVLGQIGYSGATSYNVTHAHVTYQHMGEWLDPFNGPENRELRESMLFNQSWVESITNWNTRENDKHLTLNNKFYVTMRNRRTNTYTFRANREIGAIRVEDQYGRVVPDLDILENPNLQNLNFTEYPFNGDDGSTWTVYEVSFRWYQDADSSVINKEIPFLIETPDGRLSNRVFVKVTN